MTATYTGNSLDYEITGGVDKDKFTIYSDGYLRFNNEPDYNSPTDANRDNIYNLTVTVTDSNGLTDSQDIIVIVTQEDINNPNPAEPISAPDSVNIKEIKSQYLSILPVTPTDNDPLAQPLAVGDITKGLTLSYSYPAYTSPVSIYILMVYENLSFFITQSSTNSNSFEFTTEMKPLFANSATAKSGTIFSIPASLLKQLDLTGEYSFYSGVFPTNNLNKYDIIYFSVNVAP